MSHRREKRARQAARVALMTAVSLEAILIGPHALAAGQQTGANANNDDLEELVVTGYRASLKSALDNKRNSNQAIESIVAEDIGKMPDQNVAESLQRLPGIQINRSGGKGTKVLIDGIEQNLITLNGEVFLTGREFYSSGEGSGGGGTGNAQTQSLEGIPSEEIGGIDVIKNPQADQREGGLGGTVNLKTRSALAQTDGFSLAGNARLTKSTGAEGGATPQITLVAGYKASDNFAITGSLSYDDQKTHTKEYQAQNRSAWMVTDSATAAYTGSPTAATLSGLGKFYITPQHGYFTDIDEQVKTKGATLGTEWKWNEATTSSFNWFYVKEDDERFDYSNKLGFNGGGAGYGTRIPGIDPNAPYNIDANGVVLAGNFSANGAETATLYQHNISEANNFQFVTTFGGGGPLTGDIGAFYARATQDMEADQADVEHGYYNAHYVPANKADGAGNVQFYNKDAQGNPILTQPVAWNPSNPTNANLANNLGYDGYATNPSAPGCDNFGANCTGGNHGFTFSWTNGGTSGLPTANYRGGNNPIADVLTNKNYVLFKSNWAWANLTEESNLAFKANAKYKIADAFTFSGGVRLSERNAARTFGRYLIDGSGSYGRVGDAASVGGLDGVGAGTQLGHIPCCFNAASSGSWIYYVDPGYTTLPYSTGTTNPGLMKTVHSFGGFDMVVKDPGVGGMTNPSTYLNTVWNAAPNHGKDNNTESFFVNKLSSFHVTEKTTSAYLMGDYGAEADVLHANFGLRLIRTGLTVVGGQTNPSPTYWGTASWNGVNKNDLSFEHSRSYTDVLPSLNFKISLNDSQKIRVGAARVVAPQDLNQLALGNAYNFTRNGNDFVFANGAAGNPDLDPYRADQFNASWEDYISENGLISAGLFYKKVGNFVVTQTIPTAIPNSSGNGSTVGPISKPVNAGEGKIYGFELNGLYSWDSGFGVSGNYTYSSSKSDLSTSFATNLEMPGVSKSSLNFTLFYEKSGLNARLAYSYRSSAVNSGPVGSTFTFNGTGAGTATSTSASQTYGVFAAAYGQLDGQIGYDINKHIGFLLSASNITNSKQHTYLQFPNQPFTYDDSGRRFFIGVKGKL